MRVAHPVTGVAVVLAAFSMLPAVLVAASPRGGDQTDAQRYRIVVIAGEDAVNIIQQRIAVAPLVEVRDQNDLPVAGVPVTFAITSGRTAAFAGDARTLTVATNAAGRASAPGFNPLAPGAVQINVTAVVQGQTLAVTITQRNFMTAAQAAQAGVAVSSGTGAGTAGGAGGGGGRGGGGLSWTTVGIVSAGVGLAAVSTNVLRDGAAADETFRGRFRAQMPATVTGVAGTPVATCTQPQIYDGELVLVLQTRDRGVDGEARVNGTLTFERGSCPLDPPSAVPLQFEEPVSGMRLQLGFRGDYTSPLLECGANGTTRLVASFSGGIDGTRLVGQLTFERTSRGSGCASIDGAVTVSVTLQK